MPRSGKSAKRPVKAEILYEIGSNNIFRDLGFSDEEAANLHLRGLLAIKISEIIKQKGWSQRQAAREIGVPQPRIAEIMKSRIDHYSIDLLIKYIDKLGFQVSIDVEPKTEAVTVYKPRARRGSSG
jgi:predicted XRE-type DNA-binding protein